jgi:hypothetical protein
LYSVKITTRTIARLIARAPSRSSTGSPITHAAEYPGWLDRVMLRAHGTHSPASIHF